VITVLFSLVSLHTVTILAAPLVVIYRSLRHFVFDAADYDPINLLICDHCFHFQSADDLPSDPNDLWDAFVSPINNAISQYVPVKSFSRSRRNVKL